MTRDYDASGDSVKKPEDADPYHEHLKPFSLPSIPANLMTDPEQSTESGEEESHSEEEVDAEWYENKTEECHRIAEAHVTHAGEFISIHNLHDQYNDCFDGRDGPGSEMEVGGVSLYGLVAPF
jgi:hypothetical protein